MANKIEIIIDGDNIKAVNAISGVETKLKGLDSQSKKSGSVMDSVFGSLSSKIAFGVGAAVAGIGVMIKSAVDLGDEINDLSKKSGMSAENLSTMKYAAELSGSSFEQLGSLVIKLNKNIYEAGSGNKELAKTFNQLGVPIKDAQGNFIQIDQALYALADRFKLMPDGAQKSALAIQIFGKAGADMIPMLNEGSAGLIKMQEEARKLGLEISQKTAAQMDEFKDKLTKIEGSFKGLAISLVTNFGPAVTSILSSFADGLDVVFGKTQLINGVQFKDPIMGIATMNEITKDLVGTSKEYRAELILHTQQLIATALGEEKIAEFKLQQLDTQLGILTLLTDEDNIQEQKIRTAKSQVAALTQQLDLIKKISGQKPPKISGGDDEDPAKKAKKLADEWANVSKAMRYENMVAGLDPQSKKLSDLIYKANQLKEKYYAIPGAIEQINYNLQTLIAEQFKVANLKMEIILPKKIKPELEPLNPLDDKAANEAGDRIKNKIQEIGFASQLNFEIMQGYGSAAFGAMGDAANAFYELSGNKSKELFMLQKAFSIGQAIMNTYEGASKALAQGGIFGPIMAAAVIAFGLANVARIASQQPTTSSAGGGGGGGSVPSLPSPRAIQTNSTSNSTQTIVNKTININGDVLDVQAWLRKNRAAMQRFFDDGNVDLQSA